MSIYFEVSQDPGDPNDYCILENNDGMQAESAEMFASTEDVIATGQKFFCLDDVSTHEDKDALRVIEGLLGLSEASASVISAIATAAFHLGRHVQIGKSLYSLLPPDPIPKQPD